jgi:hypothetical protein
MQTVGESRTKAGSLNLEAVRLRLEQFGSCGDQALRTIEIKATCIKDEGITPG